MKSLVSLTVTAMLFGAGIPLITSRDSVKRGEYIGVPTREVSLTAPTVAPSASGTAKAAWSVMLAPSITATNTYTVTDDQGVAGPSAGDELEHTVHIVNSGTDAFKVIFKDVIDENTTLVAGSVKVAPIVADDEYYTIGNVGLNIPAAEGVLANDLVANGATLEIVTVSPITTSKGGTVELNTTTGAFTYTPAAGFSGTDTFEYAVRSGSDLTATGTVSIELAGRIWFINSAASPSGANGTLSKPFNSIDAFQAINDGGTDNAQNGDNIFIYYAASPYDGSFTLRDNQKIIGQGAGASLLTIMNLTAPDGTNLLPSTGGTSPVITTTASAANAVNVAKNNLVRGVNVTAVEGAKISGTDFGTLVLRDISLSGKGTALLLNTGTLDAGITELSSTTQGAPGVSATGVSGQLECTTGTINSSGSTAIDISGTAANIALGLEFVSISSSQAAKGLALFRTTGTFNVSGTGAAGSGGSISDISGRGAEFRNAAGITLKYMTFSNANTAEGDAVSGYNNTGSNAAVYAGTVNGLRLENVTLGGTMVQTGVSLNTVSNFHFINGTIGAAGTGTELHEGNIYAINTSGTCSIVNSSFSKPTGRAAYFRNNNTNLTLLTVDNSNFTEIPNGPAVLVEAVGNSVASVKVTGNDFLKNQTTSVVANAYGTAVVNADIKDNTFDPTNAAISPHDVGVAVDLTSSDQSDVNFNVLNNNVTAKGTHAINVFIKDNGYAEGTISNNTIAMQNGGGAGISVRAEDASGKAEGVVLIANNTITGVNSDSGIKVSSFSRSLGRVDATIQNNSIGLLPGGLNSPPYNVDIVAIGSNSSVNADYANNGKVCANIKNNIIPAGKHGELAVARVRSATPVASPSGGTEILLPGTGTTFQQIWENNGNTPVDPLEYQTSGTGKFTYGAPACALPDIPALRLADAGETEDIFEKKPLVRQEPVVTHRPKRKRNLPATGSGESGFSSARQASGETVLVNGTGDGFTLPESGEVTIKFRVTINTDIPEGICSVSNQGTINGEGFTEVLTDDPGASGTANPTVTTLLAAPVINTCPGNITYNLTGEACTQEASFSATAVGCPAPAVTYEVGGSAITFPYNFPTGTTRVNVRADNGVGVPGECYFDVTVTCTPLPVTLARFEVRKEGRSAILSWETTSETNAERFSVQKSADAQSWTEIGTVGARNKGQSAQRYAFTDADFTGTLSGTVYYRLKMIDLDASFSYSEIRTVAIGRAAETLIYPNPVSDQLQLDVQDWKNVKEIEFFDLAGRRVYRAEGSELAATVSVKGYAAGMYLVSIRYVNGTQTTRRFQVVR